MTDANRKAIEWRPEWLRRPSVTVGLICGCPGSGKSTYVKRRKTRNDVIIDLDLIKSELSGVKGHIVEHIPGLLVEAIDERNRRLDALADGSGFIAWVIMGLPRKLERDWWTEKLAAKCVVVETPLEIAAARILDDPRRLDARELHLEWARRWWVEYEP